jgi:GTP-binding protein Era
MILVEPDSQKGIMVRTGGAKIHALGIKAWRKLQEFFGVKVFLDLRMKVDKNWMNNAKKWKKYG